MVDDVAGAAIAVAGVYAAAALLGFRRPFAKRELTGEPAAVAESSAAAP